MRLSSSTPNLMHLLAWWRMHLTSQSEQSCNSTSTARGTRFPSFPRRWSLQRRVTARLIGSCSLSILLFDTFDTSLKDASSTCWQTTSHSLLHFKLVQTIILPARLASWTLFSNSHQRFDTFMAQRMWSQTLSHALRPTPYSTINHQFWTLQRWPKLKPWILKFDPSNQLSHHHWLLSLSHSLILLTHFFVMFLQDPSDHWFCYNGDELCLIRSTTSHIREFELPKS